jgi:predicted house-cleaning noncanonical NTP pyrophosphatase (MazG superfamily)
LDKDVRNVLTMALSRGPRANNEDLIGRQLVKAEELRDRLMDEAKKFMDTENAEELKELLNKVIVLKDSSYDTILVKYF